MLLKSKVIWTSIGQVIRLRNEINFSRTPYIHTHTHTYIYVYIYIVDIITHTHTHTHIYIYIYIYIYILIFFFHHTTCESTRYTISSSAAMADEDMVYDEDMVNEITFLNHFFKTFQTERSLKAFYRSCQFPDGKLIMRILTR